VLNFNKSDEIVFVPLRSRRAVQIRVDACVHFNNKMRKNARILSKKENALKCAHFILYLSIVWKMIYVIVL